ncbi:MAG: DUF3786 domain-containing protein [Myxococcota bacterium]|nr:DUF3786 domain-containing protein [Myxococcota bacterium]
MPGTGAPGVLESDNYGVALRLAAEKLRTLDPPNVAVRTGTIWEPAVEAGGVEGPSGAFLFRFLGTDCRVEHPGATVWTREGPPATPDSRLPTLDSPWRPAPIWDSILVLHYLGSEGPVPAATEPVAFAQVPSGAFYDAAFQRRSRAPVVRAFGARPERLLDVAASVDGRPWNRGDASLVIPAFPRVDVYVVIYRGDDEFPADGTVLFSSNVASFLSTEDVAVLAGMVAGRLGKALRALG